ncbi:MAG: hypothetical protein ABIW49_04730 [Knoellia sp.]
MTQLPPGPPPQGPPQGPPPQGPPPQGPPPQGQPPYGSPNPYGQYPPPSPGLPSWAKTLFGFLIGLPVSIFAPILAFALVQMAGPVELKVFLVTLIPTLLGVPLLFGKTTRPWGVGLMLGLAIGSFVLGGACVSIINGTGY